MQDFHDLLTAASQEEPAAARMPARWNVIFEEFRRWLNKNYATTLKASLKDSSAPGVRHLVLWPRGRRNERTIILSVYASESSVRILGKETPEISTEDGFKRYLADFVRLPAFHASLDAFKARAAEPVTGVLRINAERKARTLPSDVPVEISLDQQMRLEDASEAEAHSLEQFYVKPTEPTSFARGTYEDQMDPTWLVAGGYALGVTSGPTSRDPNGLVRLSGTPVPLRLLD